MTSPATQVSRGEAHAFLVITSLTSVLCFSGVVFGWGALSGILIQEGYYSHLCSQDHVDPCEAQLEALNNAYTLGTTMAILAAFVNGWLVDMFGPANVSIVAGCVTSFGLVGAMLCKPSAQAHGDPLDLFSLSVQLIAVGGGMTLFIGYKMPFVVPSHFALLVAANSCLYDAATVVFPVLKVIYDAGVSFHVVFGTYTVSAMLSFFLLARAWDINGQEFQEISDKNPVERSRPKGPVPLEQRGLLEQLSSWEFVVIFIYTITQVPRANMFLGSWQLINSNIADLHPHLRLSDVEHVATITGFIIPCGFFSVPLIEVSMQHLGSILTLQLITTVGILYNALQLIPLLYLQLLTACIFTTWRAFLYSVISAFNGEMFGVKTMGRIMGLCFGCSGITNLLTGPLVNEALDQKDFVPLLLEGLCVCIPLPIIVQLLYWKRSCEPSLAEDISEKNKDLEEVGPAPDSGSLELRRRLWSPRDVMKL